jgi:hypothetical protein
VTDGGAWNGVEVPALAVTHALAGVPRRPGRGRRRPPQARPSSSATTSTTERALPSSAVQLRCWSRPTTTTRLPLARDPGGMLGLVAPHDDGAGMPERCSPVMSQVRGHEASACPGHAHGRSLLLPGRAVCRPLEPGDGGHRGMPRYHQGQALGPTKSAMHDLAGRGPAQESSWLAGRLRLGVGHASTVRPDPATLDASDTVALRCADVRLAGGPAPQPRSGGSSRSRSASPTSGSRRSGPCRHTASGPRPPTRPAARGVIV